MSPRSCPEQTLSGRTNRAVEIEPAEEEEVDKFPTHCLKVGLSLAKDLDRE